MNNLVIPISEKIIESIGDTYGDNLTTVNGKFYYDDTKLKVEITDDVLYHFEIFNLEDSTELRELIEVSKEYIKGELIIRGLIEDDKN